MTPQDVAIDNYANPSTMRIRVKADQLRKGIDLYVGRTRDGLCPVAAMLAFLSRRGMTPGPLFCFPGGRPLSRLGLVRLIKSAVAAAGMDPSGYNGHSFCIGAATTAAARGIGDATIQTLGRWQSDSYKRYIQIPRQQLAMYSQTLSMRAS